MRNPLRLAAALVAVLAAAAAAPAPAADFTVPVEYYKLGNGLKVVLSRDPSSPKAVVAVYYGIGFRIEPRDRTGFAHLFEHMMFQGSENLGKMEFVKLVQSNGGIFNGSTRFDFTNYFEIVPSNTLETALWAEADRMRGLAITQDNLTNQQGVVKSEVRVNVLNQPYGGFPWLDMPQYANTGRPRASRRPGPSDRHRSCGRGSTRRSSRRPRAQARARTAKFSIVVVGDRKVVDEQVAPYGKTGA